MAGQDKLVEDLGISVVKYARLAVEEAYQRHYQAGRVIVLSKNGQLIQRQLGYADVVLKNLPPRRKVSGLIKHKA